MKNIVLFGPPGAGKGTQADRIKNKYNLFHISTGDVFRYNISKNTDLGLLAKSFMEKGDLVPDQVTIKMLENEVEKFPKAKGFIFDGFPRTTTQAEILDDFLDSKNMSITMTIALDVDEDLLIDRLINRGKESGRIDDQDRTKIQNRFTLKIRSAIKSCPKFLIFNVSVIKVVQILFAKHIIILKLKLDLI